MRTFPWLSSCLWILLHFWRHPVIIFKITNALNFIKVRQTVGPNQINLQGRNSMKKRAPTRPYSSSTSTITPLRFLSHCCSVNFCENHCHGDRRYSKIACLLDLPGMERLFYPPLFFLQPFILLQLQGQRHVCLAFHSWAKLLRLWAIKMHKTVFQATMWTNKRPQNNAWVFHCGHICMLTVLYLYVNLRCCKSMCCSL